MTPHLTRPVMSECKSFRRFWLYGFEVEPTRCLYLQNHPLALISAVGTLPFAVWEHVAGFTFKLTTLTLFAVLYVAIFPSVISYAAYTRGIELIGPNRAGPFLHLIPLYSALLATVFLGERLMAYHAIGFLLILTGVWLASRK